MMMNVKTIAALALLASAPALAQTAPATPPTPAERSWQMLYQQEAANRQQVVTTAIELSDRITALQKQVAELTAENAKLKAPPAPDAKP
jgi:uncharacterized small protein (DUF1192 family)